MNVPYDTPVTDALQPPNSTQGEQTRLRKDHHIDLCLEADVAGRQSAGFAGLRFDHNALPELALEAIDTRTELFGVQLEAPFIIGAMTGGSERAGAINSILADAASACGVGMALGSQRAAIENPDLLATYTGGSKPRLRIGNIGAVQLNYGVKRDDLLRLIEGSQLDALALHLNPLQEAIQPEGDTDFSNLRDQIHVLVRELPIPVILKEVGSGISEELASWARQTGVAGLETAGVGGTSWAAVEGFRGADRERRLGEVFRSFGLPTLESLRACRRAAPRLATIASGGLRTGLDGAKAIAMGASAFAMAQPLLEAAHSSTDHDEAVDAVSDAIRCLIEELRISMFCTASRDLTALRQQVLHPLR